MSVTEKGNNLPSMTTTTVLLNYKGLKLTLNQMPKMSGWETMFLLRIVPISTFRNQSYLQQ